MFCVYLGSILTAALWVNSVVAPGAESSGFVLGVGAWLWFTVLFANFAEAIAEGHGKAQAASLRQARTVVKARKLTGSRPGRHGIALEVPASDLKADDIVIVKDGETIPADGEVIEGVALPHMRC